MERSTSTLDDLVARAERLVARGGRLLGIAGAPGSGKSTLAAALVDRFGDRGCLLPMDGFHLADEELRRRNIAHRKGAPDTFDVDGYIAVLHRVRDRRTPVLAPRFRREIEEPIAGAIRIDPSADLVVTEGNYLLLRRQPWALVAPLLDETWMLDTEDSVRRDRLIARHERFGRTPEHSRSWVADVDDANATLIGSHSSGADLIVRMLE